MHRVRSIFLIIFFAGVVFAGNLYSQKTTSIVITDNATGKPLSYANVCFEDKANNKRKFVITNKEGYASEVIYGPTVIAISSLGYTSLIDTIFIEGNYEYSLQPTIFDMDEVVVTAQLRPKKVDNSIYKVSVINNLNIHQKAANNLSELLSTQLNFRVTQDGALGSGLVLNGLKGEHIKILIDGVPVTGRMNGNIDLNQLNLNNVDHIEIVEGPMSVQYGSNALGGAINIITKENTRHPFIANIGSYYESVGVYNFDGNLSSSKGNHNFSITPGRNFFSGYPRKEGIRTSLFRPKEQYFSDAYYIYSKGKTRLKIDGKVFHETVLQKGPLHFPAYGTAFDSYFYTDRISGNASFKQKFSENSSLELSNSYAVYNRKKNTYLNDLTRLEKVLSGDISSQDTSKFTNFMSRGAYSYEEGTERFGFQLGYDINLETGTGKRILDTEQEIGDYALFGIMNFQVLKKLEFQTGLRQAWNTKYDAPFVPSLNIKYQALKSLGFRGSYVRGFRAPSLKELYLEFVDINHNILPSPDLQAETSHNFNLSSNYSFDFGNSFFNIDADGFYNEIENSIQLAVADPESLIYGYVNLDGYNTSGGSLKFKYRLHPRFEFIAGTSATNHRYYNGEGEARRTEQAQSYEFSSNLNYNLIRSGFSFSIFYKHSGKYPVISNSGEDLTFSIIDGYNMMDFTANKSLFNKRLIIGTGVKNIFNVESIFSKGGGTGGVHSGGGQGSTPVSWGRTWFLSLRYSFMKD